MSNWLETESENLEFGYNSGPPMAIRTYVDSRDRWSYRIPPYWDIYRYMKQAAVEGKTMQTDMYIPHVENIEKECPELALC